MLEVDIEGFTITIHRHIWIENTWFLTCYDLKIEKHNLSTNDFDQAIGGNGRDVSQMVEEYDPKTDIWTRKADMPTGRASPGIAEFDGKIYAMLYSFPLHQRIGLWRI